jgi:hypothetical protein
MIIKLAFIAFCSHWYIILLIINSILNYIRFCIIDYGLSANKKKILNREYDYNKRVVHSINNNKYDALTLIVITHLLDNNTIEVIQ